MRLIDRALALIGLRRINRKVQVRLVGDPTNYRAIAEAIDRGVQLTRDRHAR